MGRRPVQLAGLIEIDRFGLAQHDLSPGPIDILGHQPRDGQFHALADLQLADALVVFPGQVDPSRAHQFRFAGQAPGHAVGADVLGRRADFLVANPPRGVVQPRGRLPWARRCATISRRYIARCRTKCPGTSPRRLRCGPRAIAQRGLRLAALGNSASTAGSWRVGKGQHRLQAQLRQPGLPAEGIFPRASLKPMGRSPSSLPGFTRRLSGASTSSRPEVCRAVPAATRGTGTTDLGRLGVDPTATRAGS